MVSSAKDCGGELKGSSQNLAGMSKLKYGVLQRAAFTEAGGKVLQKWIDECPNQLYSALTFKGGSAWRPSY